MSAEYQSTLGQYTADVLAESTAVGQVSVEYQSTVGHILAMYWPIVDRYTANVQLTYRSSVG